MVFWSTAHFRHVERTSKKAREKRFQNSNFRPIQEDGNRSIREFRTRNKELTMEERNMTYDAKEAKEVRANPELPEDTIMWGAIVNIQDGLVKDFITEGVHISKIHFL